MFSNSLQKMLIAAVTSVLIVTGSAIGADNTGDPITLNIGLYNSSKPSVMVTRFRPVLEILEEKVSSKLGKSVRIRMQIAKDYDKSVAYLASGKVDIARLGPASYVEAKSENPGIQILALESKNGTKVVNGIIAAGLHSSIRKISDLKGESIAFGDKRSTSGRYMAQQFLLRNGIAAKDLNRYEYHGRHDIVGVKVGVGDFTAGALPESTFRRLLLEGEKIRELGRFPIVSQPWVARAGLDPAVYSALKLSLLEMSLSDEESNLDFNGFVEGSNEDFRIVADSMSKNHRFFSDDKRQSVEWVLATSKSKNDSHGKNIPAESK